MEHGLLWMRTRMGVGRMSVESERIDSKEVIKWNQILRDRLAIIFGNEPNLHSITD